jgi:hypothetical protein
VIGELSPILERLRSEESVRAFFLFGSLARKEQGAFSDIDVRVVTDGAPKIGARMTVLDVNGVPTHVSFGARALESMLASARSPAGWAFMAGFVDVAVALDATDAAEAVRAQLREALVKPARLESESGLHSDLEDIVEHLAKTRNAYARGESERVYRHAWHVAKNARRALVPFGPVEPARRGGETEERALATMPRAFREDLALVAGETPWARDPRAVAAATARVARDVVVKLEALTDAPLRDPLRADLTSGRVRALVDRMHLA